MLFIMVSTQLYGLCSYTSKRYIVQRYNFVAIFKSAFAATDSESECCDVSSTSHKKGNEGMGLVIWERRENTFSFARPGLLQRCARVFVRELAY